MGKRTLVAAAAAAVTVPLVAVGGATVASASARPAFFQSVEAEGWAVGNDAHVVQCGSCSGGARVAGLGGTDNGVVTIYVDIPEDAVYTVTVYYTSAGSRDLSLNDKRLRHLDSGGWEKVAKRSVKVRLEEHFHRPAIIDLGYDTHTVAADVDRIVVSR
jgi:hypothetical protein